MDKGKQEALRRFINDKAMSEAVYYILLNCFLINKNKEVNYLAGSMIAVEKLQDAWIEIERYKEEQDKEPKDLAQVGL